MSYRRYIEDGLREIPQQTRNRLQRRDLYESDNSFNEEEIQQWFIGSSTNSSDSDNEDHDSSEASSSATLPSQERNNLNIQHDQEINNSDDSVPRTVEDFQASPLQSHSSNLPATSSPSQERNNFNVAHVHGTDNSDDSVQGIANDFQTPSSQSHSSNAPASQQLDSSRASRESWRLDIFQEIFGDDSADDDNHSTDSNSTDSDRSIGSWFYNDEYTTSEEDFNEFEKMREMIGKDENNQRIRGLVVSPVEIILAVLKFGLTYNLNHSAMADLFKMINVFFGNRNLPDTRYLVDELFNSKSWVEYHAVCPGCKNYVGKFDYTRHFIRCNSCNMNISLKDPTYNEYFALMKNDNSIALQIKENFEQIESVFQRRLRNNDEFNDFTDGVLYKRFIRSLPANDRMNSLTVTFNSDGSPVFKSSKVSMWPIQMVINEIPYTNRTSKTITCGIWFGKDKPNMNIFLKPYVTYMNKLANNGISCIINGVARRLKIFALCCCVDSVARPPMQGLVQYNGYFGCSWCMHPGVYVRSLRGGCIKYTLLDELPAARNEIDTLEHMLMSIDSANPIFGVKNPSILTLLSSFNIVKGFVPDSLHCICLGVGEQILGYWLETSQMPYSLSNQQISQIDDIIKNIKAPNQICRLTRSIKERRWWKGREWENWILYYSLLILLFFRHMQIYAEHWALFVEAFYILNKQSISRVELNHASTLLNRFVVYTEFYYTQQAMTYNIHQLLHLTQSVVDWGPLWSHNGYCFENGNGRLVEKVHAAKGVISQLCRSISMSQSEILLKHHISVTKPDSVINDFLIYLDDKHSKNTVKLTESRYFGPWKPTKRRWIRELNLSAGSKSYKKIVKGRCLYNSSNTRRVRSDNSFAVTANGDYIRILEFIYDEEGMYEYTLCRRLVTENVFGDTLCTKRVRQISQNITAIQTNTLEKVCCFVDNSFDDNYRYVCAVPNLHYY